MPAGGKTNLIDHMNKYLSRFVILLTISIPFLVHADLLVYKGTFRENYVGDSTSFRVSGKLFIVVDLQNQSAARLEYTVINGSKEFHTRQLTNIHILQVTGPKGKLYTAFTHIPSDCEAQQYPDQESMFFNGANALLIANTNSNAVFYYPKVMNDAGNGLFYSQSTHHPVIAQAATIAVYNQSETLKANGAGETLDAATARYSAYIESLGYILRP
jgi:hypothetical protein